MSTALLRAHQALHAAGLGNTYPLRRLDSAANEVWSAGPYVLRVSNKPGGRRLEHEVHVASMLPRAVPYPRVMAYGRVPFGEWLLVRRVQGQVLSRAWPALRLEERRRAVHQLGRMMKAVHAVHVGTAQESPLSPPFFEGDSLECPHQMPLGRVLRCLERARALPHVDTGLLDAATAWACANAASLDDGAITNLVHGDLHFENVLWGDGEVSAVLDFEFARRGPADLDLEIILRFCAEPSLHVAAEYAGHVQPEDYRPLVGWLREAYPELFAHPSLAERLNLYSLSYDVRDLLVAPPDRPVDLLAPFHPYHRVRRLVDGRGRLQLIDW